VRTWTHPKQHAHVPAAVCETFHGIGIAATATTMTPMLSCLVFVSSRPVSSRLARRCCCTGPSEAQAAVGEGEGEGDAGRCCSAVFASEPGARTGRRYRASAAHRTLPDLGAEQARPTCCFLLLLGGSCCTCCCCLPVLRLAGMRPNAIACLSPQTHTAAAAAATPGRPTSTPTFTLHPHPHPHWCPHQHTFTICLEYL
jgi:hypothetical protein